MNTVKWTFTATGSSESYVMQIFPTFGIRDVAELMMKHYLRTVYKSEVEDVPLGGRLTSDKGDDALVSSLGNVEVKVEHSVRLIDVQLLKAGR